MAIGGSITLITQAVARYMPSISSPLSHQGRPMAAATLCRKGTALPISRSASICDGMLAPVMVIQKTTVNSSSIMGKPQMRLVTRRSMVRSRSKRGFSPGRVTARSAMRGRVGVDGLHQRLVEVAADLPAQGLAVARMASTLGAASVAVVAAGGPGRWASSQSCPNLVAVRHSAMQDPVW